MTTTTTTTTAPDWYVNHFRFFGYTTERLNDAWTNLPESARDSYRRSLADNPPHLTAGRATIYGDYVAHAIAAPGQQWHIAGTNPDQPDTTLCGKHLHGTPSRMRLHVSLLECSTCMQMGGER